MNYTFKPETWTIGELYVNPKGAKSVSILCGGETPTFRFGTPENPVYSPYGAGSWDENTRLSIDFTLPPDLQDFCVKLDTWAKKTLYENSEKLFNKKLSKETLELMYQSIIKKHSKGAATYSDTVRCKFNTTGLRKLKCWDENHKEIEIPDFKYSNVVPLVHIKGFWISNNSTGLTLEISDMLCLQAEKKCPF
jgi:hypothetical protein